MTAVQPDLYNIGQEGWIVGFKERLKEARVNKGWTQADAAKAMGMGADAVYRKYELGQRKPGLDIVTVMADTLDVSIDWLAGLSSNREIHDRIPLEK